MLEKIKRAGKIINKNHILVLSFLAVAIMSFVAGKMFDGTISTAALSDALSKSTQYKCISQKCVPTNASRCSIDSDCVTTTKKTTTTTTSTKTTITAPQQWCQSNNPGLNSVATVYPNGNFSCMCYSAGSVSTRAQITCASQHQNQ